MRGRVIASMAGGQMRFEVRSPADSVSHTSTIKTLARAHTVGAQSGINAAVSLGIGAKHRWYENRIARKIGGLPLSNGHKRHGHKALTTKWHTEASS